MTVGWHSLITVERVLELHAQGIREHSQAALGLSAAAEDCVEGRLGNAWNAEVYSSTDDDARMGLCFSGYLLYYLVRDHCFPDGNKRAAWAASMAVLASIGLTVRASTDDAYFLVDQIAHGVMKSGTEVVQWIAARLEAPEDPIFTA
jgi:death-on-curing protein